MGGLTRDGTAEPVSRDKNSRHELEFVKKVFPLFSLSQEGTELVPNQLKMIDHTDKHTAHTYIQASIPLLAASVYQTAVVVVTEEFHDVSSRIFVLVLPVLPTSLRTVFVFLRKI